MSRTLVGIVTSDKGEKTIVITVHTRKTHPIYKKQYSVTQKIMAHDEKNEAKLGDKVEISECRPLSARKRFTLARVVETAKILHVEPEEVKAKAPKEAAVEETK
ncbi:MAG: rpsQ [Candidatus Saccharibacteria bacterium]|nr:rpsQ [Candidatus Saccharibacteria bacterium]